ncbi:hypothetical protein [Nitriliruptor alkaliphilus]|uniref:hypothetical protein n=1 Tax=Nitriliruptor alkaliphilus TaxID=427918 RepID=UPI0006968B76|nr:hypothetical protein [Nitriliruptor alkaliphilus]
MRRITTVLAMTLLVMSMLAGPALAQPLPENCERVQGTVTCTTEEGPGENQAGVGCTTETETKGNTTNTSPTPQNLETTEEQNPEGAQGDPITC